MYENYKKNILGLCLLFCLCGNAFMMAEASSVTPGRLSFTPQQPRCNNKVHVRFDPRGGDLEYGSEVTAVLYFLRGATWKMELRPMQNERDVWVADVELPDGCSFLALRFIQGELQNPDLVDNNDGKGYFTPVFDDSGKPLPGSFIGQAMLLAPQTAAGAFNGYYKEAPSPKQDEIKKLLQQEEKVSGPAMANFLTPYLQLKRVALGDEAFGRFSKEFFKARMAEKEIPESFLSDLYVNYSFALRDSILGKEAADRILRDYPGGNAARFVSFGKIMSPSTDGYENIARIEAFMKEYPVSEWRKNPDNKGFIYHSLYSVLGRSYYDTRQFDKFVALFQNDLNFKTANEVARWNIERSYLLGMVGKDTLYDLSSQIMPLLLAKRNDGSFREDYSVSRDEADRVAVRQLDNRLFTHISLLYDLGKYEEARSFFFELSERGKYRSAELNEINLKVMEKLGLKNEILPYLEMCVKYNAATPMILEKLQENYVRLHGGNVDGFDAYIASLKSDEEKEAMRKYVMSHITDFEMPSYRLEMAKGGTVSSDEMKDKIVVMDFWATWCRPCIMAMPGMQLVADKFVNDPEVEIFLVGTMQTGDYKTKSVDFIRRSGYRFDMLHDAVNPSTGEQDLLFSQIAPYFESSGIPRKIIVKNGVIRYSSEGYSGSPSKLADEISLAIEILKNEK